MKQNIFFTSKNNQSPFVIAHRGFSEIAPENSFAAFNEAIKINADMIECDVRLSSDDEFVVIHDKNLLRTTNINEDVKKLNSEIIKQLDCGSWFNKKYCNEKIPLLKDLLNLIQNKIFLNIEIKPDIKSKNGLVPELFVNAIKNYKFKNYLLISSFNHKFISEIKKLDQTLMTGVLYNSLTDFQYSPSKLVKRVNGNLFICNKLQINSDVVTDAHKSEIPVFVYGLQAENEIKKMIDLKVDGLIANNPKMVIEIIKKERNKK